MSLMDINFLSYADVERLRPEFDKFLAPLSPAGLQGSLYTEVRSLRTVEERVSWLEQPWQGPRGPLAPLSGRSRFEVMHGLKSVSAAKQVIEREKRALEFPPDAVDPRGTLIDLVNAFTSSLNDSVWSTQHLFDQAAPNTNDRLDKRLTKLASDLCSPGCLFIRLPGNHRLVAMWPPVAEAIKHPFIWHTINR